LELEELTPFSILECPKIFDMNFKNASDKNVDTKLLISQDPYFLCYYGAISSRIKALAITKIENNTKNGITQFKISYFDIAEGIPLYKPTTLKFLSKTAFLVKYQPIFT
jgi:hypothetical protein